MRFRLHHLLYLYQVDHRSCRQFGYYHELLNVRLYKLRMHFHRLLHRSESNLHLQQFHYIHLKELDFQQQFHVLSSFRYIPSWLWLLLPHAHTWLVSDNASTLFVDADIVTAFSAISAYAIPLP